MSNRLRALYLTGLATATDHDQPGFGEVPVLAVATSAIICRCVDRRGEQRDRQLDQGRA